MYTLKKCTLEDSIGLKNNAINLALWYGLEKIVIINEYFSSFELKNLLCWRVRCVEKIAKMAIIGSTVTFAPWEYCIILQTCPFF